jgi:hypothetical protein
MDMTRKRQEGNNQREKAISLHSPTTLMRSSPPACHNSDVSSTPFETLQETNPHRPINQQSIAPR